MTGPLIQRTVEPCKKALADPGVKASDINEVILVGGMTQRNEEDNPASEEKND